MRDGLPGRRDIAGRDGTLVKERMATDPARSTLFRED